MGRVEEYYDELQEAYELWYQARELEADAETLDPFGAGFNAGYYIGIDRGMELATMSEEEYDYDGC